MNSSAKESILSTIKSALSDISDQEKPEDVNIPRNYRQSSSMGKKELIKMFSERVEEYKADVKIVSEDKLFNQISKSCKQKGVKKLAIPYGFDDNILPNNLTSVLDNLDNPLSHNELNKVDGVITTCAVGVAETGTIILDASPGQGRRVLTLLPDYHLCIIYQEQIVELIPEGFAAVESSVKNENMPITFISGPSATSDIELNRVEGVHGPRQLEVLIVTREEK